jgi:hypothetical protein
MASYGLSGALGLEVAGPVDPMDRWAAGMVPRRPAGSRAQELPPCSGKVTV